MNCPRCKVPNSRVLDSRCFGLGPVDRRRRCLSCGSSWSTEEKVKRGSLTTLTTTTNSDKSQAVAISCEISQEVSPTPPLIRSVSESLPGIHGNPDQTQTRVEGPAEVSLLTFPCDGPVNAFAVTESLRAKHATAYPSLDVLGEYRQALAWVEAHPSRRKTAKGMPAFLVSWLGRAQNSGRGRAPVARNFTQEANDQVRLQYLQQVAAMEGK